MPIDFAGLDVPPGRYSLPAFADLLRLHDDNLEAALEAEQRLRRHSKGALPLSALKPVEREALRAHIAEQADGRREQAVARFTAQVPRRYANASPDPRVATWVQSVAADPLGARSLLLLGPTGTGKTHLGYAALRALAEMGSPLRWQAFASADLYAHLRPGGSRDTAVDFEQVTDIPLLFLDDLGAAKFTEWTEEITYRLINRRYEKCLPGIYASNVLPGQLGDALGERVASRLAEMCDRVTVRGDDLRRNGGAA